MQVINAFYFFFPDAELSIVHPSLSHRLAFGTNSTRKCRIHANCSMTYWHPIVLTTFMLLQLCTSCPTSCICKWKNGKQTVECNNKDLLIIPEGMDSGTQVLEFNGNNLHALHDEKFLKMDLINLQRIYLSKCKIKIIGERTFKGLTNLVELDLSGNALDLVPTASFYDCSSLMRLTLNNNPIRSLGKASFNHLSFLTTLELSNCEISKVDERAFQGLVSLEWLYLNGNKLTALAGLDAIRKTLKGMELQNNPWICDCHLINLHKWLLDFKVALTIEPECEGPSKLARRTIKSVPEPELACLPDVSPTTFYLEIAEGKNVSLLCNIKAIPPAKVTWWFQGQLLQNDTIVAPGVHLLYYVEEGYTEKHSELMIYNTNSEDNGTFVCSAENSAGVSFANFTIRVILKELTIPEAEIVPFEYVVMLMSAAAVSLLILLCITVISLVKCRATNSRRNKKRNDSNRVTTPSNCSKDTSVQETVEELSLATKESSILTSVSRENIIGNQAAEEVMTVLPQAFPVNDLRSPATIRRYQLEQNPDLINGTDGLPRRREGDGSFAESACNYAENKSQAQLAPHYNLYCYSPDVHLNPVALFRANGKQQTCYKTLPYNRSIRRQSAANPPTRFSREAEFLARAARPASYEHYSTDVRYTADGYPARLPDPAQLNLVYLPSPPESHKSDSVISTMGPCCSSVGIQWPPCVPASVVKLNQEVSLAKKSVGAQTEKTEAPEPPVQSVRPVNKSLSNVREVLTESPDEGYEGESVETNNS